MSLSPWDLGGLGLSFGLYRPRRPSYTIATQTYRQRTESYRHATRRDNTSSEIAQRESYGDPPEDYIEDVIQKRRKESYVRATRQTEAIELTDIGIPPDSDNFTPIPRELYENHVEAITKGKTVTIANSNSSVFHEQTPQEDTHEGEQRVRSRRSWKYRKNLVLLCVSFIFTFSAFRAIQNLQTSLNSKDQLGLISVSCVHGTMVLTGIFVPSVINKLRAKFSLAVGMFFYLTWTAANFYPRFYTLIPTAVLAGFGQGILWTGELSYIIKLAFDNSKLSTRLETGNESEVFRFHGIFVACFQTTHMWGNLISSLILNSSPQPEGNFTFLLSDLGPQQCGMLHPCEDMTELMAGLFGADMDSEFLISSDPPTEEKYKELWQLMTAYLILGGIGFLLVLFCLDGIGAQVDPGKPYTQLIGQHFTFMCTHKTYRLLIPMIIFSGLQQGFIFADFNQAYVTCSLGIHYVGYCMITLGVSNILSAVLIAICAKLIPREVVLGFGGVTHIGLMIGFLVWIPESGLVMYLVLAAAWGACDAVWLTQCNSLICLTCPEKTDVAFANSRLLQSFGLFVAFVSGTFMCVGGKLYLLIAMLVLAILFYVMAEYRMRHEEDSPSQGERTLRQSSS